MPSIGRFSESRMFSVKKSTLMCSPSRVQYGRKAVAATAVPACINSMSPFTEPKPSLRPMIDTSDMTIRTTNNIPPEIAIALPAMIR